jgi:hypothetical protein
VAHESLLSKSKSDALDRRLPQRSRSAAVAGREIEFAGPALADFKFDEPFDVFTIPLRAEIAKQELSIDAEPGDTDASLAHVMDSVVPVLRLTTDTFNVQIARLEQIEAKTKEFERHFGAGTRSQRSASEIDKIETGATRLRMHLLGLKTDLQYTLFALRRQRDLLTYSAKEAKVGTRAEQLNYFAQYAHDAEIKLTEKAKAKFASIDHHLFELNKHILFPLD